MQQAIFNSETETLHSYHQKRHNVILDLFKFDFNLYATFSTVLFRRKFLNHLANRSLN